MKIRDLHFAILRLEDGRDFLTVAHVDGKAIGGVCDTDDLVSLGEWLLGEAQKRETSEQENYLKGASNA